jgi:hypothetical protein
MFAPGSAKQTFNSGGDKMKNEIQAVGGEKTFCARSMADRRTDFAALICKRSVVTIHRSGGRVLGLRGPGAVPPVSLCRAPPKPPHKRRCRRCNQLFAPKRRDAVYCSGECRTAIYRLRLADDVKVDSRPIFTVSFRAEQGIDGSRAFKALLKFALKKYGLRVVTTREEQSKDRVAGH